MANNLKDIMSAKEISLDDMAKLCDVSVTTVTNWRKAETLKRKKVLKISEALGVKSSELIN